jgi:hypothetical protein
MNEVESIGPVRREVQEREEEIAPGKRCQSFLHRTHDHALIAEVAKKISQTFP